MTDPTPATPSTVPPEAPAAPLGVRDLLGQLPSGALVERMGIRVLEGTAQRLVGTMPVEGNTQVTGLLHGGASCVLAETLGSIGAMLHVWPDAVAVGTDINATHHRSATSGLVTGVATAISLGRTLCSHEVVLTDDAGRRLCTARITNLVRPRTP
ncbi:PaaI family thioesterase [Kineococcus terrestris]|uniref:PaaI family thioesterase n=1 Tax=Kineococcus terrestris TaxID=2044856 RepID=UPI0035A04CCF